MNIDAKSFFDGSFANDTIHLHEENWDIGGGRITIKDIDELANHPDAECVMISGLRQDTFEYFIRTYGSQLQRRLSKRMSFSFIEKL